VGGGTQIKDAVPAAWGEGAGRELLHYRLTVVGAAEGWTVGAVVGMTVGHVVGLDDGASVGTCVKGSRKGRKSAWVEVRK
jgi:hypothetical protein